MEKCFKFIGFSERNILLTFLQYSDLFLRKWLSKLRLIELCIDDSLGSLIEIVYCLRSLDRNI